MNETLLEMFPGMNLPTFTVTRAIWVIAILVVIVLIRMRFVTKHLSYLLGRGKPRVTASGWVSIPPGAFIQARRKRGEARSMDILIQIRHYTIAELLEQLQSLSTSQRMSDLQQQRRIITVSAATQGFYIPKQLYLFDAAAQALYADYKAELAPTIPEFKGLKNVMAITPEQLDRINELVKMAPVVATVLMQNAAYEGWPLFAHFDPQDRHDLTDEEIRIAVTAYSAAFKLPIPRCYVSSSAEAINVYLRLIQQQGRQA